MNIKTLLNRFVVIVAVVGLVLGAIVAPAHAFRQRDVDLLLSSRSSFDKERSDRAMSPQRDVDRLRSSRSSSRKDCPRCDLSGANLSGRDLTNAFLPDANLQGADLQGANLQGAMLQGADLQRANLQRAKLRGAYLLGAMLQGATLPDGEKYLFPEPYGMDTPPILSAYDVAPVD